MMLIKGYNKGDVISFKLTSGEEIIARLDEVRSDEFIILKPMALINTPQGGLGMMPVPLALNHDLPAMLNKHAVAIHGRCQQDIASQYLEKTTGLAIATSV